MRRAAPFCAAGALLVFAALPANARHAANEAPAKLPDWGGLWVP
jgi:hypothetical protein